MKKLFAIMLAVVMLLASAACAEGAGVEAEPVADAGVQAAVEAEPEAEAIAEPEPEAGPEGKALIISDPKVSVVSSERQMALDLSGLSLALVTRVGDPNTFVAEVRGDGEMLMRAQVELDATRRILFALEDVTGVFCLNLPQTTEVTVTQSPVAGQATPVPVAGVPGATADPSLVTFDVNTLVQTAMSGIEIDTSANPMTFKAPYTTVNETLRMLLPLLETSDVPSVNIREAKAKVDSWVKQDSGINLEGSFASGEDSMAVTGTVIPVKGGEVGESAFSFSFTQNGENIHLDVALTEMGTMSVDIAPNGDMQLLTVGFNSDGANILINADITTAEEAFDFLPLNTAALINIQNMSRAESTQFSTEFSQATNKVFAYVFDKLKNASNSVISEVVDVSQEPVEQIEAPTAR